MSKKYRGNFSMPHTLDLENEPFTPTGITELMLLGLNLEDEEILESLSLTHDDIKKFKENDYETYAGLMQVMVEACVGFVAESDFILVNWDKYCQRGAGTSGEITFAATLGKPVILYISDDTPRENLPGWIVGCLSILVDGNIVKALECFRQIAIDQKLRCNIPYVD